MSERLESPNYLGTSLDNSGTQDVAQKQYAENVINALTNIGNGFKQTITNVSEEVRQKQRAININKAELDLENLPSFTENFIKQKATDDGKQFYDLTDEQVQGYSIQAEQEYVKNKNLNKSEYYNETLEVLSSRRPKISGAVNALVRNEKQIVVEENVRDLARSKLAISRNPLEVINNLSTSLENDTKAVGTTVMAKRNQLEGLVYNAIHKQDQKAMETIVSKEAEDYFKDIKEYHPYSSQVGKQLKAAREGSIQKEFDRDETKLYNSFAADQLTPQKLTESMALMRKKYGTKGKEIFQMEQFFAAKIQTNQTVTKFVDSMDRGDFAFLERSGYKPGEIQEAIDGTMTKITGIGTFTGATIEGLMNPTPVVDRNDYVQVSAALEKQKTAEDTVLQMRQLFDKTPRDYKFKQVEAWANAPIPSIEEGVKRLDQFTFLNGELNGQLVHYFTPEALSDMYYAAEIYGSQLDGNQKVQAWKDYGAMKKEFYNTSTGIFEHPEIRRLYNKNADFSEDVNELVKGDFWTVRSSDDLIDGSHAYSQNFIISKASFYYAQNKNPEVALERAEADFKGKHTFEELPDGRETIIPNEFTNLDSSRKDVEVLVNYLKSRPEVKAEGQLHGMEYRGKNAKKINPRTGMTYDYVDSDSILEDNIGFYPHADYNKNQLMVGYINVKGIPKEVVRFRAADVRKFNSTFGTVEKKK